jgi:coenzyme PQQ precursor peptide PqqA
MPARKRWKKPTFVEISVGLEIGAYAPVVPPTRR